MDEDILIEVKLDDREIVKQMDALSRKLQRSLNVALGGSASSGNTGAATRAIKDQETAALRLAQAHARLATASGDLSKAQTTLTTALAGVNKETVTSIQAQTQLAQVHNRMSRTLRDMAGTLQTIGSRLTIGLTLPLVALGAAAIKTAVDFDSLKRGLISVSGSSAEAEKQLVRLKEVAKLPGLSFREAIQGSINLQAAGLSAERAEKALRVFGNALATVGKGSTELSGVVLALSQIESKGKVSAEEINQLAERVPQIRRAMIAAFGTADTEIIQKAKITSRQFIDAVVTELDKLPKVTGGAKNTFENLKDSIEQSLLPLGNKLLETILPAIEKLTPKVLGLLEAFGKLSPEVQAVAIGFGAAALAAGPLISALGNILFLLTQIRSLGGIGAILGGVGGIAGAAGGAAALGVGLSAIELNQRIRAGDATFAARGGQLDLEGKPVFGTPSNLGGIGAIPGFRVEGGKLVADAASTKKTGPAIDAVALAKANAKAKASGAAKKTTSDIDLLFFAKSREFDLKAGQRGVEDQMAELSRVEIERQKNEAQAFGGIVRQIQENNAKAARDAAEAQEKFNEQLQESIKLAQEVDPSFRFMKGLRGETDAVAASFERLGQNIGDAFGDFRNLLGSLASAVKQFFGDILSATLRTAAASVLGPLLGQGGAGILGNLFRTPSFAGGDGIAAPPSLSGGGLGSIFSGIFGGGGGGSATGGGGGGVAGAAGAASRFSLGGLFGGLAGAAPLLGLGLGAGFGGQSVGGQILGAIGGGAVGLGASFGAAVFGAGGGLAQAGLAALGPIGLIGVPLLIGASLLGKAAQRRKDEQASGEFLTQALQAIDQLAAGVASGQIPGSQARSIFETQILGTFRQQISQLKTRSVVESRLTNQVNDLRKVFEARINPAIAAQQNKSANALAFSRQIPEFATGGTTRGGLALLHPGEKVVNLQQQSTMRAIAGPNIFERAGVPGINRSGVFDIGGTVPSNIGGQFAQPINITIDAVMVVSKTMAEGIYVIGAQSDKGQAVTVSNVKKARKNDKL